MASQNVSSVVPWEQVCRMLDKVQSALRDAKKEMLLKFINQYRELLKKSVNKSANESFFPVMRILLPALDRSRPAYGVKERKIADLYIRILGLLKDGNDAQKLINFRKPEFRNSDTGDFAEVAYYVLKNRCPSKGTMSLFQVDAELTALAENSAAKRYDEVERALLQMLRNMTATEQKWLIRVLVKDMKLGIGQNTIFNAWHPDAKDFYDVTNCLEKVCTTLHDPDVRLHEIEVSLFLPFRPMLAERAVLEKVESQMHHKTFYVETKYDGERSQLHKKGNQYKYFSRNGFDFTSNFGADAQSGLFTPHVHTLFASHVQEVILDGELVVWSKSQELIINKGDQVDVKNLKEDGDNQVCFCIFDLLLLNGKVLTNLPLHTRLEKLQGILTPKDGRLIITTRMEVASKDDVVTALNDAIDRREEGVILKDPDSLYKPASRKAGWIKVKPDYVDSMVPELDLLIVGGYYGTGRRQGIISHFLLAVAQPSDQPGGKPSVFESICRVGSGYTMAELAELQARLSPHMRPTQPSDVLSIREKPNVWIVPQKSCVVQVRAAEIVKSENYRVGVTLRFPRVEKVRGDKSWHEILTTDELQQLVQEAKGKLATRHYINASEGPLPTKRSSVGKRELPFLAAHFRPADISAVVKKGELFSGLEMCIMEGNESHSKQQLEKLIVENGGTFIQHPSASTHCIITCHISVRVRNHIRSSKHNVVRPDWLMACIRAGRLLTWSPLDAIHVVGKFQEQMEKEFDSFGDSFTDDVDATTLQIIMKKMQVLEETKRLNAVEMCEIDEMLCDYPSERSMFRLCNAFFVTSELNQPIMKLSNLRFRLHGGCVSEELNARVTHVIVVASERCGLKASEVLGQHLVTTEWVSECVRRGRTIEERQFQPCMDF